MDPFVVTSLLAVAIAMTGIAAFQELRTGVSAVLGKLRHKH